MRKSDETLILACKQANEDLEIAALERDWEATIADFDDSLPARSRSDANEGSTDS